MRILAFDSCGKTASVAVYDDGRVAGEVYIDTKQTHSATLLPSADWLLASLGLAVADMDYLAATVGPGSFTGVRIGMSAAKGMAFGAGLKCIGVSSLYAAAYGVRDCEGLVCAVMDARCGQVYTANFKVNNSVIRRICEDRALAIDELIDEVRGEKRIFLVGDGALLCKERFDAAGVDCAVARGGRIGVSAGDVALAAAEAVETAVAPEAFAVNYIRLSQAERERNARLEKTEETK
ncbi:MAG: tRNA (adenosine(37)-N6)-threonylcarbamoyltransferase complex dimerization subunit type 1 TsaB [Clostridia bacterium]|nr:tRNA (adenosine(37)-N6)-threonylcarbamoyltransferase complex dimerization subunit type 1 TsaB [Clostridia bacterium]